MLKKPKKSDGSIASRFTPGRFALPLLDDQESVSVPVGSTEETIEIGGNWIWSPPLGFYALLIRVTMFVLEELDLADWLMATCTGAGVNWSGHLVRGPWVLSDSIE